MGPVGATLISVGAVLSIGGALNTVMLVGSRLPFAFSEEKQLPQLFSRLHIRFSSPVWSLAAFAGIALVVSLTGTFIYAVAISVISKIMVMVIVCAALIKFRKSDNNNTNYYKLRYGKTIAIVTIIACLWLLVGSKLSEVIAVLATISVGLAFYFTYRFFSRE
jgi:amino acid transporter